jgi:hypothetical protein
MRNFITCTLWPSAIRTIRQYYMGRTCSMNGEKRNVYRILVGMPGGRQNVSGRTILKWILEK